MSTRTNESEEESPLRPSEIQALRRIAEPIAIREAEGADVEPDQVWASRYRIVEKIGKGGMGDVYLAHDVVLDRRVALKVLRKTSDESFVDEERLLLEARAAARVEHERLARIYDALTWNDQAFIAMEYVRGETLRDWSKTTRPTMSEIVVILQQLLEGLQILHENGLVHRDLKPENIMVTPDGNLRILDLGIARRVALADPSSVVVEEPGTFTLGFGVGTPGYMAPEQWRHGKIDVRADLFALGVIGYELVVGKQPFWGSTNLEIREQTLNTVLSFAGPEWKDAPLAVKTTIEKALARDPSERFQSVSDMAKELAPLFRPTLPPISGRRSHPIRPPGDARRESLSASVVGIPVVRSSWRAAALFIGAPLAMIATITWGVMHRDAMDNLGPPTRGMVRLAGGTYQMGSTPAAIEAMCKTYPKGCPEEVDNETPAREVTLAPFEIDRHEVTNEEFARFLTAMGATIRVEPDEKEKYPRYVYYEGRPGNPFLLYDMWYPTTGLAVRERSEFFARNEFEKLPVTLVTWLGARLYCKSVAKRLPTDAEWEFAARGRNGRLYPWGNEQPDCDRFSTRSNGTLPVRNAEHCVNDRTLPVPVMTSPQDVTPDGIFDMGGGVLEWVDKDENVDADEAKYLAHLTTESTAVYRGGAFDTSFMTRSTSRGYRLAFNVGLNIGFRCGKTVTGNQPRR